MIAVALTNGKNEIIVANAGGRAVRFNETAGSMAKDSVFNAASVVRMITGKDIHDYDIHINVIGGGNIDGPSAGTAIPICFLTDSLLPSKTKLSGNDCNLAPSRAV